jgi:hypothetical protein
MAEPTKPLAAVVYPAVNATTPQSTSWTFISAPYIVENDHITNGSASSEIVEAFIDLIEPDPAGNQFIQLQLSVQVRPRQQREVAGGLGAPVARASDPLLTHQRPPPERHVLVEADLAQPNDLAADTTCLCRTPHPRRQARSSGISSGMEIAHCAVTMAYSAKADM